VQVQFYAVAMMAEISGKVVAGLLAAVVLVVAVVVITHLASGKADVSGENPPDRIAAIHEITVKRPSEAGRVLAKAATSDPSPEVREAAMAGLTHFLAPEHRSVVEKGMADSDVRVRAIAADTLGLFRDRKAANMLIDLVNDKKQDERVCRAALRGMVRCNEPKTVVTLLKTAENGSSPEVKLVAMKALLRKFGMRISPERDPSKDHNDGNWRDLIQRWKQSRRVRQAYADANEPLVDRPQDLIGKDWHPERRRRQ